MNQKTTSGMSGGEGVLVVMGGVVDVHRECKESNRNSKQM